MCKFLFLFSTHLATVRNDYYLFSLVLDTLKKHDPKRRCFRSVGGVLVERTVADVMPAVEYNAEQVRGLEVQYNFVCV